MNLAALYKVISNKTMSTLDLISKASANLELGLKYDAEIDHWKRITYRTFLFSFCVHIAITDLVRAT